MAGVKAPRTYPAPAVAGGGAFTVDELEMLSNEDSALGVWAGRTYRRERDTLLASLSDDTTLPQGLVDTDEFGHEYIFGLDYADASFTSAGWVEPVEAIGLADLNADEVAFVARALNEGVDRVYFRPYMPSAFLDLDADGIAASGAPGAGLQNPNAIVAAVVDELDKNAVLDLLAISPGPIVQRRHDGEWRADPAWLHALRSVKPPLLVQLQEPAKIDAVIKQIDAATEGQPFSKEEEEDLEPEDDLEKEIVAAGLAASIAFALQAGAANRVKGKAAGAEKLRQYWLHGKGAAKIRWQSPGAWTRCYHHLSKYMGPRAKGYCQLMMGRATGTWAGRNHSKVPSAAVKAEAIAKQLSR